MKNEKRDERYPVKPMKHQIPAGPFFSPPFFLQRQQPAFFFFYYFIGLHESDTLALDLDDAFAGFS